MKQIFRVITEVTFDRAPRKVTAEDVDFVLRQTQMVGVTRFHCDPLAVEDITAEGSAHDEPLSKRS